MSDEKMSPDMIKFVMGLDAVNWTLYKLWRSSEKSTGPDEAPILMLERPKNINWDDVISKWLIFVNVPFVIGTAELKVDSGINMPEYLKFCGFEPWVG